VGIAQFDVLIRNFEVFSSSQIKCLGFKKTEFKLIVNKTFNIKLFLYGIRAINLVSFVIISICKIERLNI